VLPNTRDVVDRAVHRRGHRLVHRVGLVAFDEVGRPTATAQEAVEFVRFDPCEHR